MLLRKTNSFIGDILSIAERLKKARESMRMSQSEFAKIAGASFAAWQGYESGKNIPGGKVLETLAEFGFNGHWLLTGKGSSGATIDSTNGGLPLLGKKIKELRGDRTPEEFAELLGVFEADLENIEEGIMDPSSIFLSSLSYHLDINPIFFWRSDVDIRDFKLSVVKKAAQIDIELLKAITTEIEEALFKFAIKLDPAKKAELLALVYDYAAESEENRSRMLEQVDRLLRLVR